MSWPEIESEGPEKNQIVHGCGKTYLLESRRNQHNTKPGQRSSPPPRRAGAVNVTLEHLPLSLAMTNNLAVLPSSTAAFLPFTPTFFLLYFLSPKRLTNPELNCTASHSTSPGGLGGSSRGRYFSEQRGRWPPSRRGRGGTPADGDGGGRGCGRRRRPTTVAAAPEGRRRIGREQARPHSHVGHGRGAPRFGAGTAGGGGTTLWSKQQD